MCDLTRLVGSVKMMRDDACGAALRWVCEAIVTRTAYVPLVSRILIDVIVRVMAWDGVGRL